MWDLNVFDHIPEVYRIHRGECDGGMISSNPKAAAA